MRNRLILFFLISIITVSAAFADIGIGESESGFLTSRPPEAPELYSPAHEAQDIHTSPVLSWHSVQYTSSYQLQVSATMDFTDFIVNETSITDTCYTVSGLNNTAVYYWRVCAVNAAGSGEYSTEWMLTTSATFVEEPENNSIPENYALLPLYPNPFNGEVTLTFTLPEPGDVSMTIFNSRGQVIQTVTSQHYEAGIHQKSWNARDDNGMSLPSGLYLCQLKINSLIFVRKMVIMR